MSDDALTAFESLKAALISAPLLSHPDFTRAFCIQCDASSFGIGAVLSQSDNEGNEKPIAFFSQKLNSCQRNYSVTEQECLAAVQAVKKFRPYIEGTEFSIITDHASLKWLMSTKDLSGRLARWSLKLQAFDFVIQHRKGTAHIVPDTLSRAHIETLLLKDSTNTKLDLNNPEFVSEEYRKLIEKVSKNAERFPDLKILEAKIYKRTVTTDEIHKSDVQWRLWIPSKLTNALVEEAHNPPLSSHGGMSKTLERLRKHYFWPNMVTQVRDFVRKCSQCKQSKPSNETLKPPMRSFPEISKPFQKIYIDFLGPYVRSKSGNLYLFIVLDHATKFVLLKAMPKANSAAVIRILEQSVFNTFGVPEIVHSDNGKQFVSKEFGNALSKYGVKHFRTALYSPQSNASERVNQTILSAIRSYLHSDQREWDQYISEIQQSICSSVHQSIGVSPYFALFGTEMVTHGSTYPLLNSLNMLNEGDFTALSKSDRLELIRNKIRDHMRAAFERNTKSYNLRAKARVFQPGQELYRRNFVQSNAAKRLNAKLCQKFLKCRVIRRIGQCMYEIENMKGKRIGIFHAKDLKT